MIVFPKVLERINRPHALRKGAGEGGRDLVVDGSYVGIELDEALVNDVYFDLGDWSDCEFRRTKFQNCYWFGSIFDDSNLANCLFQDCIFYGISFINSKISNCTLNNCAFHGAGFCESVLEKNDFSNVSFLKDNLHSDCRFDDCDFSSNLLSRVVGLPDNIG